MYDTELAREILNQVNHATELILNRFKSVKNVIDFTNSPSGMEKLDSICMQQNTNTVRNNKKILKDIE